MTQANRFEVTIDIDTDPTIILSQKTLDTMVAAIATAAKAVSGVKAIRALRAGERPYQPVTPYAATQNRSAEAWVP